MKASRYAHSSNHAIYTDYREESMKTVNAPVAALTGAVPTRLRGRYMA